MTQHSKLHKNDIDSDFTAETKAAGLVESGIPIDQIELFPNGGRSRAFAKDIEHISSYISEWTDLEMLRINTNREGLYDMLPEGIFHNLSVGREILDEDMMIHDIRQKRTQEREARQFFAPFESELNQFRLRLSVFENRLDLSASYDEKSKLFQNNWEELELLDHRQKVIWLHFLAEIQHHKNDLIFLTNFLRLLLDLPVSVKRKTVLRKSDSLDQDPSVDFHLGKGNLGVHAMVKNALQVEIEIIEVQLGPASSTCLSSYLPQQPGLKIIQSVFDYLLPVSCETEVVYSLLPDFQTTVLSSTESASMLGHTSYL